MILKSLMIIPFGPTNKTDVNVCEFIPTILDLYTGQKLRDGINFRDHLAIIKRRK